jgi:ribosomal protein S18 acetylase RimI-like enzyme
VSIHYRRWTFDDLPAVQKLLLDTWLLTYSLFIPESDLRLYHGKTYNLEALKAMCEDPGIRGFVALADTSVVGFARTKYASEERRFYVSSIYIRPDFQKKGIGKQLMVIAADEARALGLDRLWIGVMEKNVDALEWYKKFGYQVVEQAPFTMGASIVNHFIGFVPVRSLTEQVPAKSAIASKEQTTRP